MILLRLRKKTRIADLVVGQVATLIGVVDSQQSLTIPPSGTTCVFYSLMQESFGHGQRGRGRPLWFVESFTNKCARFTISDGSGVIAVQESGDRVISGGAHQEVGSVAGRRNKRYAATFIRAGDTVIARGQVAQDGTGGGFVLSAPPKGELGILVTRHAR